MNVDLGKLLGLVIGMLCITALMVAGSVDQSVGMPVLAGAMFYLTGNGVAVASGKRPTTIISRADVRSRAEDAPVPE